MNCQQCQQPLATDAAFCPHCGTAVSAPSAQPPAPVTAPVSPPAGPAPLTGPPPMQTLSNGSESVPESSSPKRGRLLAVGAAVVGLIGIGFIGFRLTQGVGSEFVGGASSPEGAVEQFVDSLNSEDVLGALSFIAPDEVDGVADVVESLIDTLDAGVGGIGDGSEADVTIELAGVSASMEGDNAAVVEFQIAGGITSTATTGPLGVSLPTSTSFEASDLDGLFPGGGDDVQLVTVKLGGNWYVSPMLSFGNLIAEYDGLPSGDFDLVGEERSGGGNDPEDAVEQLFDAIADFNVDDVAEALGGGEGRFVTVFADAIQDLVDEIPADVTASVDVRLSELDDGQVEVEEVEGSVADFESFAEFSAKNDCLTVSDSFDTTRTCVLDEIPFESSVDDTLILDTVEEDGGTRVRLVPSAADIASRIVSASSRELLLYAVGLEWADTATEVAVGSDTDIDFDGRLYVVHEFEVAGGSRYTVDSEENDTEVWLRDGDEPWDQTWRRRIEPEQDGTVRIVTYSEDDCSDVRCVPSGDGRDTLRVRSVPRQSAEFPAILSGELGPGNEILFDLTVTEGQNVQITLRGGSEVSWRSESGDWDRIDANIYRMEPGDYTLVVRNGGNSSESYEIVPSRPVLGFAGSTTVSGSLTDGEFITEVGLVAGSWSVAARPSDDQDIVLVIDGADCAVDEGFAGDEEICYIEVSRSATFEVEVYGYSRSDSFGTVTLSLG